jgi:hypothetical protein
MNEVERKLIVTSERLNLKSFELEELLANMRKENKPTSEELDTRTAR